MNWRFITKNPLDSSMGSVKGGYIVDMKDQILEKINENQLRINQSRPLTQTKVKNLKDYFKIGLTYASNALEGNTLTESETKVVIEDGITIGGKPLKDHLDTIGNARAFDYLWELAKSTDITEQDIKELHKICFQPKDGAIAGQYRQVDVIITGSQHNDKLSGHEEVPDHMQKFIHQLAEKRIQLHPVVYAATLHRDFIYIHPFEDGNGRTARLIMNHALLSTGYPPVIISPAFKHEYIQALEKSHSNSQYFINYISEQVLQAQRDYIRLLRLPER
jgi:Fic family protein